jgi:hypothetical protein
MLFKLVLDILNVSTKGARSVYSLPCFYFKLGIFPVLDDILSKLGLKFKLLISRVSNIFNIFLESKQVSFQKLLKSE